MEGVVVVGGGGGCSGGGRRRVTLLERMSAVDDSRSSLAGLTLDAVLSGAKRAPSISTETTAAAQPVTTQSAAAGRTLLDIIRDEEPHKGQKDKKSWKTFRDRLRLKRAGAAWTSSVHVPTSDIIHPLPTYPRGTHVRFVTPTYNSPESTQDNLAAVLLNRQGPEENMETETDNPAPRPMFARRSSTRVGSYQLGQSESTGHDSPDIQMPGDAPPERSFRPQISRASSTRYPGAESTLDESVPGAREGTRRLATALAEERALSAREAAAAQEAAEAAAAAAQNAATNEEEEASGGRGGGQAQQEPVRMSLMDLLEETDRQMGFSGSRYAMGEDDEYDEDEEDELEEEQEDGGGHGGVVVEHTCCVCMVRHKGAAFIPCGHTFCRLCSRELWVQRGNCPLCNGFILEILDIF